MKIVAAILFVLCSMLSFSQTISYYHHGFDGLVFWESKERPEKDLFISSFGAKTSIRKEVGYLLYSAYKAGKLDSTVHDYVFSTADFKVSGFVNIVYTETAILLEYTYVKVQWPDGRIEIYQPLD
jgi:hypothetical protein